MTSGSAGAGWIMSTQALADAAALAGQAMDGVRAAAHVEWTSRAADLYRADAAAALHGLARDVEVLDGLLRQAGGGW